MFLKLYRSYLEKIDRDLPDVTSNRKLCIGDANYLVNSSYIVYIDTAAKVIDGEAYYRIQISGDPVSYYYITTADYKKITKKEKVLVD